MNPDHREFLLTRMGTPQHWQDAQSIRFEVFVDEQEVPADEELDDDDPDARHWVLYTTSEIPVGTARAVEKPDGSWKIGRVAVRAPYRGRGAGLTLMQGILHDGQARGVTTFKLDSQTHAIPFYARLGFEVCGPEFMDCGIPHRHMVLNLRSES